jgi:hypothetical protein
MMSLAAAEVLAPLARADGAAVPGFKGLGFRVEVVRFRGWSCRFRVQGFGFRVKVSGFELGLEVLQGLGLGMHAGSDDDVTMFRVISCTEPSSNRTARLPLLWCRVQGSGVQV